MALQCNIDARGKRVRLINGILTLVIALVITATWAWPQNSSLGWTIAACLLAAGAFMIFEARHGWCVLRAMGVKTRI